MGSTHTPNVGKMDLPLNIRGIEQAKKIRY